mgnify:CR=1 FL=1
MTLKREICIEKAEHTREVQELTSLKQRMSERYVSLKQRCDDLETQELKAVQAGVQ